MNLLKRAFLLGAVAAALPAAQAAPVKRAAPVRKAPARLTGAAWAAGSAAAPVRKAPARRPAAPARAPAPPPLRSPVLLTVSGAIKKSNRGPLDKAIDQMAAKHGLSWEQAYTFDAAALANLPAETIHPTLEYDGKPHALSGPTIEMVLALLGITPGQAGVMLALRAVDGYRMELSLADVRAWKMILANRIDGQSLAIGGLGPLWAVYDADRLPGIAELPLAERFQRCPWGLYHIEVLQT